MVSLYEVIQDVLVAAMLAASSGYLVWRLAPATVVRLRRTCAFWLMHPDRPRWLRHQARWIMPRTPPSSATGCSRCGGCASPFAAPRHTRCH